MKKDEGINEINDEITRISEGISDKDILNEDARIMGDCNDNDTPLEVDTSLEEAEEYGEYSMTHTAHRDEECYGCATQRYSCEHDELDEERYVKLDSVGSWLDLRTGYTFPILKDGTRETNKDMAVHLEDCSYEWIESLKGMDKTFVGIWFKVNRK